MAVKVLPELRVIAAYWTIFYASGDQDTCPQVHSCLSMLAMPAGAQAAAADEAATQDHDSLLSPEGIAMDTAPDTQEQLFAVRPFGHEPMLQSTASSPCSASTTGSHSMCNRDQSLVKPEQAVSQGAAMPAHFMQLT